jgi:hypothetical protein
MASMIPKTQRIDFEALGYKTMVETGDQMGTMEICANQIHSFALELKPKLLRLSSAIQQTKGKRQSLWSHLYDRPEPVSDAKMLGSAIAAGILTVTILVALVASLGGHAMTFYLFGSGFAVSVILGADRLPPQVRHLVNGTVINLSGASAFYKKKAEVVTLLRDFVEALPDSHYRLKNQFESWFLGSLAVFFRRNDSRPPADILADALFLLGQHWAKIDYGKMPIGSIPTDKFLREAWKGAEEWDAFLRRDARIGQGWLYEMNDDGTVRNWSGEFNPDVFDLFIRFGNDTKEPPTMRIDVKGKAVALFMDFWMIRISTAVWENIRREKIYAIC